VVNGCIQNPHESAAMGADDPRLSALQAYIAHECPVVSSFEPVKH